MEIRLSRLPVVIALLTGTAIAQSGQITNDETDQRVQHLMNVEVGIEGLVPNGMSVEAKEVFRSGAPGKDLIVKDHIFIKGAPANTTFRVASWPVGAETPSHLLDGASVGENGILLCAGRTAEQCGDKNKPDDPIEFTISPLAGEPLRIALVAPQLKVGIVIVPDPIVAADRGCTLSAVRLTPNFDVAFISGTGYPRNADVHYRAMSATTVDRVIRSDAQGRIRVSLVTETKDKVMVRITEPACSPEITFGGTTP